MSLSVCEEDKPIFILIGDGSHGSSEFHLVRGQITRRIIENGLGPTFLVLEWDAAETYRLNQFILGKLDPEICAADVLKTFSRWPAWMWATEENAHWFDWLKDWNKTSQQVSVYGSDVFNYSHFIALAAQIWNMQKTSFNSMSSAWLQKNVCALMDEWPRFMTEENAQQTITGEALEFLNVLVPCLELWTSQIKRNRLLPDWLFVMRVLVNMRDYYALDAVNGVLSWDMREMCVSRVLRFVARQANNSVVIFWGHNTHVGDSDYGVNESVSVGNILRSWFDMDQVTLIGTASGSGTVLGSRRWSGPSQVFPIQELTQPDALESLILGFPGMRVLSSLNSQDQAFVQTSSCQRVIGAQVGKGTGDVEPSIPLSRFDFLIVFPSTRASHPLFPPGSKQSPASFY